MTPSLVVFDLDGTLVDSAPDIARALNATMAELGAPELPVKQVVGYVGDGAAKLMERALGAPPEDDLVARFRRNYAAAICVESRLYPGIPELLERLRAAGLPIAVLTNKPGDLARALLAATGLGRFVGDADVVGDGDGWPRKPAPDGARHLFTRHAVRPEQAVIIGDGVPDLRLARAAGCRAIAAGWGYTSRDVLAAEAPDAFAAAPAEVAGLLGLD